MKTRAVVTIVLGVAALIAIGLTLRPYSQIHTVTPQSPLGGTPSSVPSSRSDDGVEVKAESSARSAVENAQVPAESNPAPTAWAPAEAAQRANRLNQALSSGTASLDGVLDFAVHALQGLDPAESKAQPGGSMTWNLKASDGSAVGTLRVLPITPSGIRQMQLSIDSDAQGAIVQFAGKSKAKLEVSLGFGDSGPAYCTALSRPEFDQSRAFMDRMMDVDPLRVGGVLKVDGHGESVWQGMDIRAFMDKASKGPVLETKFTAAEPRGRTTLDDPRVAQLQQVLASAGKR
jgi:hypothetical protein